MTIITEKKLEIAKENNLEIIGQPIGEQKDNIKYLYYKFLECGHRQNIDTNLVRKKLFKCRQCEQQRLEDTARSVGLKLLERAHKGTPGLYEFESCGHTQRIGYDAVGKGLFRCRTCYYEDETVDSRRQGHAEKQGLVLVENSDVASVGVYKRLSCGHTFNYQHSAIKAANKGKYRVGCEECKDIDASDFLKELGATLVKRGNPNTTYIRSCGHEHSDSMRQMKNRGLSPCKYCKTESVISKAMELGLEPTENVNSYGKGTYKYLKCEHTRNLDAHDILEAKELRCKRCNHEDVIQYLAGYNFTVTQAVVTEGRKRYSGVFDKCGHSRVIDSAFLARRPEGSKLVCTVCTELKHETEAERYGLHIVGPADNKNANYRKFQMPCCGSHQDLEITHVRRGSFVCHACEQTKYHKPTSVYLLAIELDEKRWLKLGLAIDIEHRSTQYGLPERAKINLVYANEFSDGYIAVAVEKSIHKSLKSKRLPAKQMKNLQMTSGFTECYPINMQSEIILKIKDEEWQNK